MNDKVKAQEVSNIFWKSSNVTSEARYTRNGHRGVVVWFTGLSGAGKSTLAHELEKNLFDAGCQVVVLDGDNVRHGLCSDLSFSEADRKENIRRVGEVAKLFAEAGLITITAFISPFQNDREWVRKLMPEGDFLEVFIDCPLEVCEERDVKGLYKRARAGEISAYTGISSPYEPPLNPECVVNTTRQTLTECLSEIMGMLVNKSVIPSAEDFQI